MRLRAVGGYGGADFYLGLPSAYGKGISAGQWGQRANIFAGYIQDDWRATQNLTVNLGCVTKPTRPGLRPMICKINFDLITGEVIAPNCSKVNLGTAPVTCKQGSRGLYNGTYGLRDFQPRIGFAWTPAMLGGKTVFRGALQHLFLPGRHGHQSSPPDQSAIYAS